MKTKKMLITAIVSIAFITGSYTQNVNIPDAYFKAALVGNASINTNMDSEIQITEANSYSGSINVAGAGIANLTGIEAFVALDSLDCSGNGLLSLNVSANTALTYLNCSGNSDFSWTYIDSLDVSANSLLTTLICSGNGLLSLNTTGLTALTYLDCSYNERGYLEGSGIGGNSFFIHISYPFLNFTGNTALTTLICSGNGLLNLNTTGLTVLTYLDCSSNEGGYWQGGGLGGYNWVHISYPLLNFTGNTALTTLICSGNGLLSLNTTGLTALTYLDCSYNEGGYWQSGLGGSNWVHISYPLLNFTGNTALTYLNCSSNGMTSLNVSTCSVLTTLNCWDNSLTNLDVSANTALTYLSCQDNQISTLDVSGNTALFMLECQYNQLTSLDLSVCTALTTLNCSGNPLTNLDVSVCTALTTLNCSGNDLTNLNVSVCTALTTLNCPYNQLTSLDVKNGNNINMVTFNALGNPSLSCIEVDDVQWSIDNWTAAAPQTSFFSENCSAVGILDNNETKALMFYPNPTTGTIYLSELANISLSDFSGKLLLEEENTNQLDMSALPAGMYFLHFGENNQQTFKVIKE